jgi:hypothetical protein
VCVFVCVCVCVCECVCVQILGISNVQNPRVTGVRPLGYHAYRGYRVPVGS